MKLNIQSGQIVKECWHFQQTTTERPCVFDGTSDTKKFLKKLGFPDGCGIASAPSVFQKLWRKAFDVNRTQLGIR